MGHGLEKACVGRGVSQDARQHDGMIDGMWTGVEAFWCMSMAWQGID